jgi:hypothetical protein
MSSALRVILGVSILGSLAVGCDGGSEDPDDNGTGGSLMATSGTANNTSGTSTSGSSSGGTGGTGMVAEGVPLPIMDGWVDASMAIGIQGAIFAYGDPTSKMGWMDKTLMGTQACLAGTAAKVDMTAPACATMMFTPPATDCYGEFWGAAIGLNLNQPIDMTTMKGVDPPLTFDAGAKAITGFAFEISGTTVPTSLRFKVENSTGEFCNIGPVKAVMKGPNSFKFSELHEKCYQPKDTALKNPTAETGKANLVKIAWQVVTNTTAAVPFDYCVSNIRALTN